MTGADPGRVARATHHSHARRTQDPSVCVVGNGYVGTVVAASFASIGHTVVGLEADPAKLGALRSGRAPFHEPGLRGLLECGLGRGSLAFKSRCRC